MMMNDYDRDTGENAINSSPTNTPRAIAYGVNRLGSRHASNDTFHLDLHSSSQPNLDPSSSTPSPTRQMEARRKYKLDYYSIPVFLLEVLALTGLGYIAYYIHYEQQLLKPKITGFYCDDNDYKHIAPQDSRRLIKEFESGQGELQFILLAMLSPLAIIIFCELVNSMFGSLKFRKIRSACVCCKLHSITRRTLRIVGAYLLGFLLVFIATDLLSITTGRLRPYFGSLCPEAYSQCQTTTPISSIDSSAMTSQALLSLAPSSSNSNLLPNEAPTAATLENVVVSTTATPAIVRRETTTQLDNNRVYPHVWISLIDKNMDDICKSNTLLTQELARKHLVASWPSLPASIISYICIYLSYYLSYVGTARPFRMITCILVSLVLMSAAVFDIELVKVHYQHWEDVASSVVLSFLIATFVVIVYLNRFKDSHYYEKQKLSSLSRCAVNDDDDDDDRIIVNHHQTSTIRHSLADKQHHNGTPANDIALKYFHIPRANYRGSQVHH